MNWEESPSQRPRPLLIDNVINCVTYLGTPSDMRNSLWRQNLITEMMTRIWDRLSIIRLQTLDMNWKDHRRLLSCYAPANGSHLHTAPKRCWKTAIWGASLFLRRKAKHDFCKGNVCFDCSVLLCQFREKYGQLLSNILMFVGESLKYVD